MKKYLLFILLMPSFLFGATTLSIHEKYGLPSDENLIKKGTYILSYDLDYKIPNWVAYHLSKADLENTLTRSGTWKVETKVDSEYRAKASDYSKSGYDKGHLCPSADMARSAKTMQSTFCYSNCAPQVGKGFNRDMWEMLEEQVRAWAKAKKDVWIFAGVYFDPDNPNGEGDSTVKTIGNGVGVPPHWYKIIYAPNGPSPNDDEVIAFEFENIAYPDTKFREHEVTVRQIEDETGLDFLNKLPKAVQDKLETKKEVETWN